MQVLIVNFFSVQPCFFEACDLLDLKQRIVILTGGMGKLGTEFTEALVKANAQVAIFDIVDRPNPKLSKLSKNYPILFFKIDITDEKEVQEGRRSDQIRPGYSGCPGRRDIARCV